MEGQNFTITSGNPEVIPTESDSLQLLRVVRLAMQQLSILNSRSAEAELRQFLTALSLNAQAVKNNC
jgi:hypothetical protein